MQSRKVFALMLSNLNYKYYIAKIYLIPLKSFKAALLILFIIISSCAGSSSSNKDDNINNIIVPDGAPPSIPFPASPGSNPDPKQDNNSYALNQIKASTAKDLGLSGRGVIVAHLAYSADSNSGDNVLSQTLPSDSIITANKEQTGIDGLAPDSQILPLNLDTNLTNITQTINRYKPQIIYYDKTDFIPDDEATQDFLDFYKIVTNINNPERKIIIAPGLNINETNNNLNELFYNNPEIQNLYLNVVSVDQNNQLSSFSSPCGISKFFCLAAPGANIKVINANNKQVINSGNNLAAAYVAGATSLLLQYFPDLTKEQIVSILLNSATDLGEEGVDDIYGYGLLNVESALRPRGNLSFFNGSNDLNLNNLDFKLSDSVSNFTSFLQFLGVKDTYNRNYYLPINTEYLALFQNNYQSFINNHLSFKLAKEADEKTESQNYNNFFYQQFEYNKHYGNLSWNYFYNKDFYLNYVNLRDPFFGFVREAQGGQVKLDNLGIAYTIAFNANDLASRLVFNRSYKYLAYDFELGFLNEKKSFFDSNLNELFANGNQTNTYFLSFIDYINLSNNFLLSTNLSYGLSKIKTDQYSIANKISNIHSNYSNIALIKKNFLNKNDNLSLSLEKPLNINQGKIILYSNQYSNKYEQVIDLKRQSDDYNLNLNYLYDLDKVSFLFSFISRVKNNINLANLLDNIQSLCFIRYKF